MSSLELNVVIKVDGRLIPIRPAYKEDTAPTAPVVHSFTLAAAATRVLTFDSSFDGDSLVFLAIGAVTTADPTVPADVAYSFTDSSPSDVSDSAWTVVSGLRAGWETFDLSVTNKLYIYNHTAASIDVTVVLDVEG